MPTTNEKTKRFAANSIFPTFFYAAFGFLLAQVAAMQMHGSWGFYVCFGVPGLVLAGLALFRARLHWPTATVIPALRARALSWYLLLIIAGVCAGLLISAGSAMLLGVVAALTYLLPWMKIPVCRGQFFMSSLAVLAGAITWLVIYARPAQPMYFIIAAWILYVPSMFMYLLVLVSLDRGYRADSH